MGTPVAFDAAVVTVFVRSKGLRSVCPGLSVTSDIAEGDSMCVPFALVVVISGRITDSRASSLLAGAVELKGRMGVRNISLLAGSRSSYCGK